VQHAEKTNAQIGTFGFLPTHEPKLKKPKEPEFLPTLKNKLDRICPLK